MASSRGGSGAVGRANELEKMSIEQLKALKEQADMEVNLLQDSLSNIRTATSRLENATTALNDLSLCPQGLLLQTLSLSVWVPRKSKKL
ncbi:hypothetical protein L6164_026210 [Bauhinia variegata]|uniref:Uncharacterized protein n=1 Tax=Bauhinia variegata TaxID=167791 RepID=A0ACB9LPV3_BAUVA|nr:hypothetical protein L6164_026210 [Bauhinia variegata]